MNENDEILKVFEKINETAAELMLDKYNKDKSKEINKKLKEIKEKIEKIYGPT